MQVWDQWEEERPLGQEDQPVGQEVTVSGYQITLYSGTEPQRRQEYPALQHSVASGGLGPNS